MNKKQDDVSIALLLKKWYCNNSYRLISVDKDGTRYISAVKAVSVKSALIAVYPNPFSSDFIYVKGLSGGDVVKIIDLNGRLLMSKAISGNVSDGITTPNIARGTYIVVIENNGKVVSSNKVVKL